MAMKSKITTENKESTERFLRRVLRSSMYNNRTGDTVSALRKINDVEAVIQTTAEYIRQLDNLLVHDTLSYLTQLHEVCVQHTEIDCKEALLTDMKQALRRNANCLDYSDIKQLAKLYDIDEDFLLDYKLDVLHNRELDDYTATIQALKEEN